MKKCIFIITCICLPYISNAQYLLTGQMLVEPNYGSIAISNDGNTLVTGIGGKPFVNVYKYDGNKFQDFGNALSFPGITTIPGLPSYNNFFDISGDGNVIVMGSQSDSLNKGAFWIYTFDGLSYYLAGNKMVSNESYTGQYFGYSTKISNDGKTIVIGSFGDNNGAGAAWVFTLNGSNFKLFGGKLVGSGAVGNAAQGKNVAVSGNGKIILVSGTWDNNQNGAVWIFTYCGGNFIQLGNKIVGSNSNTNASFGTSLAISNDGSTFLISEEPYTAQGAVWIYTINGSNISLIENKKFTKPESDSTSQFFGNSLDVSADGKTIIIGSSDANSVNGNEIGNVWIYTFNGVTFRPVTNVVADHSTYFEGRKVKVTTDGKSIVIGSIDTKTIGVFEMAQISGNTTIVGLTTITSTISIHDGVTVIGISKQFGNYYGDLETENASVGTITGINIPLETSIMMINPNPSENVFNLVCPGTFTYKVYDVIGNFKLQASGHDNAIIYGITEPGVYFLEIIGGNGKSVFRLIKN